MATPRDHTIHPYRLSDSAKEILLSCERKFQLTRMLQSGGSSGGSSAATVRGSAYGVGVQSYLLHGDIDKALYEAWLAYWPMLEEIPTNFQERTLNNLLQSKPMLDTLRSRYRIATFKDTPAIELSFRLDLDEKWYYVGYIDAVLQEISTEQYAVLEVKTTAAWWQDLQPLYKHSGQALGYSIILDQIAGAEQSVFQTPYLVCRDKKGSYVPDVYLFPFNWTLLDRFKWFMTLGMDVNRLNMMEETKFFPQRKDGCIKYGKVCPYFGTCGLTANDIPRAIPEDKNVYSFSFNLKDVINDHVRRVG